MPVVCIIWPNASRYCGLVTPCGVTWHLPKRVWLIQTTPQSTYLLWVGIMNIVSKLPFPHALTEFVPWNQSIDMSSWYVDQYNSWRQICHSDNYSGNVLTVSTIPIPWYTGFWVMLSAPHQTILFRVRESQINWTKKRIPPICRIVWCNVEACMLVFRYPSHSSCFVNDEQ